MQKLLDMLVYRLQCHVCQQTKQLRIQPEDERRTRNALVITLFDAHKQMRFLLQDKHKCRDAVNPLLSLLILSKWVIFEKALKPCFGNHTYECNQLGVRLIRVWVL